MEVRINKYVTDNKYYAEFSTSYRDSELDLMSKFGEPIVDFGGSFTGPPAFDIGNVSRKIKSGMPYTYWIDAAVDPDAKSKMTVWVNEIRSRLSSAIAVLRGKQDDYTGEIYEEV